MAPLKLFLLGMALVFASNERALFAQSTSCNDTNTEQAKTAIQVLSRKKDGSCVVRISPKNEGDRYRTYSFNSHGELLVFNTFAKSLSGSRSYFIFPRKQMPSFQIRTDGDIDVITSSGDIFRIDSETSYVRAISGVEHEQVVEIDRSNQGGLYLKKPTGSSLLLDCGFQMGEAAYSKEARSCVFKDKHGGTCTVANRDLFTYVRDPKSHVLNDVHLKHEDDLQLANFLTRRCKNLDLSTLTGSETGKSREDEETASLRRLPHLPSGLIEKENAGVGK